MTETVAFVRLSRGTSPYHLRNVPVSSGTAVSVTVVPRRYFPSATGGTSLETATASPKFSFLSTTSVQVSGSQTSAPVIAAYSAAR